MAGETAPDFADVRRGKLTQAGPWGPALLYLAAACSKTQGFSEKICWELHGGGRAQFGTPLAEASPDSGDLHAGGRCALHLLRGAAGKGCASPVDVMACRTQATCRLWSHHMALQVAPLTLHPKQGPSPKSEFRHIDTTKSNYDRFLA